MTEIREPDAATLEAVYNLNKHAKKYDRLADENYRKGKGATAKANAVKKDALYSVKDAALKEFIRHQEPDRVERHMIDDRPHWCVYYEDWSFHLPTDRADHGPFRRLPELCEDTVVLDGFEATEGKEHSDRSLKACLLHLEACGINANEHLEQTHVSYGRNNHFVGWSYLGDGGERIERDRDSETDATDNDPDLIECDICGKECKGKRGLSIHQTAVHDGMSEQGRDDSRLEVDDPDHCKRCGWPLNDGEEGKELCQKFASEITEGN